MKLVAWTIKWPLVTPLLILSVCLWGQNSAFHPPMPLSCPGDFVLIPHALLCRHFSLSLSSPHIRVVLSASWSVLIQLEFMTNSELQPDQYRLFKINTDFDI